MLGDPNRSWDAGSPSGRLERKRSSTGNILNPSDTGLRSPTHRRKSSVRLLRASAQFVVYQSNLIR